MRHAHPRFQHTRSPVNTASDPTRPTSRWEARPVQGADVDGLMDRHGVPEALARAMLGRGITDVTAGAYLRPALRDLPDPSDLADMDRAIDRLAFSVRHGETVGIFGDYDVDGVTSTTVLWQVLEHLGVPVVATIPDRLAEGYGLSKAGVDRLVDGGAQLIVTVDCGVTAHDEVAYAVSRGVDVLVIDHHTVPVTLPNAVAVINPHRADCTRGAEHLCAVGVTFNLVMALRRHLRQTGFFTARAEPDLRDVLDLVALGTVADVVPLVEDNRVFVRHGLVHLARSARPGMAALLHVARVDPDQLSASTFGFALGPRINAAGRLGDAMQGVKLLRAQHPDKARRLAEHLDAENMARRSLEQMITEQATAQALALLESHTPHVLVVGDPGWHPGVVGIVASRLVDRFGRPAVVVGQGGKGSGRSVPAFHLHEALVAVQDTLAGFGGHAHAAGVKVADGGLETFRAALEAHAAAVLTADDLVRVMRHDGMLDLQDVDMGLVKQLGRAAPFGRANGEPTFVFPGLRAHGLRILKEKHVKGVVDPTRGVEFIGFGMVDKAPLFDGPVDLLATPQINTWRGMSRLQLRVRDVRAAR